MIKALFRKQLLEVFAWVYKDNKSGKFRSKRGAVGYAVLYLVIFGFLGSIFYAMANALCAPLVSINMGWLYWCMMGVVAVCLGVFGSVFNTYSSLYQAKDNDMLLSMPIPASVVLLVRLSGVYAMGLMYELIVMVPTIIIWFMVAEVSAAGIVFSGLIPFVLSVLVLVLSAVLGWVVALVAGKMKHKSIVTVVVSLIFIGVYYYVCGNAYNVMQNILLNADSIGVKMKLAVYPLYHMGMAAEGNVLSMLIFTVLIGAVFAVMYIVLSRTFLRIVTTNKGSRRKSRSHDVRALSIRKTLLRKELRRFTGSSNYMLNCGLGIILMPIAAAALLWKAELLREVIAAAMLQDYVPVMVVGMMCLATAMNDMSAPSISLEGKNLWILQSLPVSAAQVLRAKLEMHLLLTLIPAVFVIAAVEWVMRPGVYLAVISPVITVLFIVLMAALGLCMNLKRPNLSWTNEIVPIKQSAAVMIALFGGWAIVIVIIGVYILLQSFFGIFGDPAGPGMAVYMMAVCVALLAACVVLMRWIFTKGVKIFEQL